MRITSAFAAFILGLAFAQPVRAHDLAGTIVNGDGRPIDGALVVISTPENSSRTVSEPDGSFSVSGLGAGRFELSVRADGYRLISTVIDLTESEHVDVALEPDDRPATDRDPGSTMSTTIAHNATGSLSWTKARLGPLTITVPKLSGSLSGTIGMKSSRPGGSLFNVSNVYVPTRP